MSRFAIASFFASWVGSTLLLSELRAIARRPLLQRVADHLPSASPGGRARRSIETFADVLGPLAASLGGGLSRAFGVNEELEARLRRIRSPLGVVDVRLRQLWRCTIALAVAGLVAAMLRPALPIVLILLLGGPLLTFLLLEDSIVRAAKRRQDRVMAELPVIAEQIGMLLDSGYSLGSALARIAERSSGECAEDLSGVLTRVRQGVSLEVALREWADTVDVDSLHRLVATLRLNSEAGDLGRLISAEARSIRLEVHRRRIELMDRRAQQVWIPVTVATLLPGVIFLAIPFVSAMRLFAGG